MAEITGKDIQTIIESKITQMLNEGIYSDEEDPNVEMWNRQNADDSKSKQIEYHENLIIQQVETAISALRSAQKSFRGLPKENKFRGIESTILNMIAELNRAITMVNLV